MPGWLDFIDETQPAPPPQAAKGTVKVDHAPEPAAPGRGERFPELRAGWQQWINQPGNRAALMQFGTNLAQPAAPGQSRMGHLTQAVSSGAAAGARNVEASRQREAEGEAARLDQMQAESYRMMAEAQGGTRNARSAWIEDAIQDMMADAQLTGTFDELMANRDTLVQELGATWDAINRGGGAAPAAGAAAPAASAPTGAADPTASDIAAIMAIYTERGLTPTEGQPVTVLGRRYQYSGGSWVRVP